MRYQDQLVRQTQKALDDLVRSAQAVPSEKLDWVPMGSSRSVLAQMQEIAGSAKFFAPILSERRVPAFEDGEPRRQLTFQECIESARESTSEICKLIAQFPDTELEHEMTMPFGGGMKMTMADVLGLHYWNLVYHLGQINQIQLMLGDREMH
jgi:hypothetical protein